MADENSDNSVEFQDLHESLLVYLLALKCYQKTLEMCRDVWNERVSSNLANLVQTSRCDYNGVLKKAERLCSNLVSIDNCLFSDVVTDIRKVLFDNALMEAKAGAQLESGRDPVQAIANYDRSLTFLAMLLDENLLLGHSSLMEEDYKVIEKCKLPPTHN